MIKIQGSKFWIKLLGILILILIILNIKISKVVVDGNKEYTSSQIENLVFSNPNDRITLFAFIKNIFFKKKEIPYVEKYVLNITGPFSAHIQVYENPIIGYMEYNQNFIYFDKNGVVVETKKENKRHVPRIDGLRIKNVTVGEKLLFDNEDIFSTILTLTQNINKYNINVDRIKISDLDHITLYINDIEVFLGSKNNIEVKIQTLSDILPEIKDLKGYLDLSKARENMVNERYIFKKR